MYNNESQSIINQVKSKFNIVDRGYAARRHNLPPETNALEEDTLNKELAIRISARIYATLEKRYGKPLSIVSQSSLYTEAIECIFTLERLVNGWVESVNFNTGDNYAGNLSINRSKSNTDTMFIHITHFHNNLGWSGEIEYEIDIRPGSFRKYPSKENNMSCSECGELDTQDNINVKSIEKIADEIWTTVKQNFGSVAILETNVSHELQPDETFIKEAEIALIKTLLNTNRSEIKIYINNNLIGYIYAREKSKAKVVIILAPTDKALESKCLVFELQPSEKKEETLKESNVESEPPVNVPSSQYPKEENVIKQEQGLPFDLEQLCDEVSKTSGSVHSLKETISAITQIEKQKTRFLLEVTGDIVSNCNAPVEFQFSPQLPVETLFLHFPERSVDRNRHTVTFLNNCKLKYIHKTDTKEEHYLLSVKLDDKTYNTGIPVNAVDSITILSAFAGRVEIGTLLNHFQK